LDEHKEVQDGRPLLLTIGEVSGSLKCSEDVARKLVQSGELPHVRIGSSVRIRFVDLESFVANRVTREWQPSEGRQRRSAG